MAPEVRTADRIIERIASSSYGVVTRRELLAAGLTVGEIRQRLERGWLLSEHRGVYRVGHRAAGAEASYLAAVRACGGRAVLSGRPAAWLWRLIKGHAPPPEVTSPAEHRVPGVLTRRCRSLGGGDLSTCRGIPITSVPRTLVDLAATLGEEDLAKACHEAGVLYRTTPRQVVGRPSVRGAAKLRRVLEGDLRVTLSARERRFLELLRRAGLPLPQTNRPADGRRVDCRWPEHRLTVELDSYRYHSSRHAWEQDRRREREGYARGDAFRRYTWSDVFEEPSAMLGELEALLSGAQAAA
jgi:very-short-patch-repair endonuclease